MIITKKKKKWCCRPSDTKEAKFCEHLFQMIKLSGIQIFRTSYGWYKAIPATKDDAEFINKLFLMVAIGNRKLNPMINFEDLTT